MLMPIIRCLFLCFVFSLSLIVGLISFLPISVIAHSLQKNIPNLIMGEVTGSWWQGQINNVTWQPLHQASVSWNLDRMALLQGQVVAKIDLTQQSITASTEVSLPLSQLMGMMILKRISQLVNLISKTFCLHLKLLTQD